MIAVLDVSAAVEILLQKEKSRKFQTQCQQAAWVIAPDLFVSEIANVFGNITGLACLTAKCVCNWQTMALI